MLGAPLLRKQLPVSHGGASLLHWEIFLLAQLSPGDEPRSLRGTARQEDTGKARSELCCLLGSLSCFPFFCLLGGHFKPQ